MRKFLWILTASLVLWGCSTQKNDQPQMESAADAAVSDGVAQENTDSGAKEVAVGEAPQMHSAIELPYHIALSAEEQGDETVVTLTIDYHTALTSQPVLRLVPQGDTEVLGTLLEQRLEPPTAAGQVTRTIRLRGTDPGVNVSVSLLEQGFGVELHETWPPKKVVQQAPVEIMEPLPAPIVVDGMAIERGVRVRPE